MLVLACMIHGRENGCERFGNLRLENGDSVYASFRRSNIEKTCMASDIHECRMRASDDSVLYVNITQDRKSKSKLVRIAGRRLGYPAHEINQFDEMIGLSKTEQRALALKEINSL
jgi:hypothetical protein